jgi:hypothetical protein
MKNKLALILGVALVVVSALLVVSYNGQEDTVGATPGTNAIENYVPAILYNGGYYSALPIQTSSTITAADFTVGSGGTNISKILSGTCDLFSSGDTIAATSSVIASCAATGVAAGDKVFVNLATSTAGVADNWAIVGASASSSANFIAVQLLNLSGGASQTTKAGTSTQYFVIKTN